MLAVIQDMLLASGLVMSTASQLRLPNGVAGPGEICLVLWLGVALARETGRLGPALTPILSLLLAFWAFFALSQALGLLMGLATEEIRDTQSALHDALSYVLLAAVSCLCVVEPGAGSRLRRIAWLFVTTGSAALALLLVNARGGVAIPGVEPWFFERLQGWSENPNQLALLCAALGLVSLHLAETSGGLARGVAALCCVLPVVVGRMTGSDTFSIIVLVTGPVFIALKLRSWLRPSGARLTFRFASAWTLAAVLPLAVGSTVVLGAAVDLPDQQLSARMFKNGGKETSGESKLRFALWSEAVSRGVGSGMIGLGPGAHLVSTPYKRAPPPNFEAHNTLLDLFTQGGLLAVLSFMGLVAASMFHTYRANLAGLTVLLSGLTIFGTFHLIVRHPIFWFVIALCLVAGSDQMAAARRRS